MTPLYELLARRSMNPDPLGDMEALGESSRNEMSQQLQARLRALRALSPEPMQPMTPNLLAIDMDGPWKSPGAAIYGGSRFPSLMPVNRLQRFTDWTD